MVSSVNTLDTASLMHTYIHTCIHTYKFLPLSNEHYHPHILLLTYCPARHPPVPRPAPPIAVSLSLSLCLSLSLSRGPEQLLDARVAEAQAPGQVQRPQLRAQRRDGRQRLVRDGAGLQVDQPQAPTVLVRRMLRMYVCMYVCIHVLRIRLGHT